jgi:two-component system sensor histidine kinase YesM
MDQGIGGVLLVDMNFNAIDEMFNKVSLGKRGYVIIFDSFGHVIFRPRNKPMLNNFDMSMILRSQDRSFIQNINGDRAIVTVNTVEHAEWRIVGISYIDDLIATRKEINNFVLWMLFLSVLFTMVVSIFISLKISRPIKMLESSMKRVSEGKFDVISEIKGDNEVESLSKTFNMMLATIRELLAQIVRDQAMIRRSELNALQAQIQPHFLYNTLDSILWMAEKGKSGEVVSMVTALSRFFRLSLSEGKSVISVAEELEQVRNYLIIQENRYKNKFKYSIEAQSDTLKCKIPKLLLQPVVENAIYHGIEGIVDEGEIFISSSIVERKLLLEVKDNGLGISPDKLESLKNDTLKSEGTSSIGLKNVSERIKLHFGKEYGLEFESEQEKGTVVKLWLPVVYEDLKAQ